MPFNMLKLMHLSLILPYMVMWTQHVSFSYKQHVL